jgi:hypothetical protein
MGHHKPEMQGRTVGALEGRVQESLSKLKCLIAKIVGTLATVKLACTMCSRRITPPVLKKLIAGKNSRR